MTSAAPLSPFDDMSADLLEILFQQLPVGMALFDTGLGLLRCNPAFAGLVERCACQPAGAVAPGSSLLELLQGNGEPFRLAAERALRGETVRADSVRVESGGRLWYWDALLAPVLRAGQVIGLLGIVIDVTPRALADEKMRESEAALRSLVMNARRFAVYRIALDPGLPYGGRLEFVSPSICDIVGTDDPTRFEGWFEFVHPDDQRRVLEANLHSLSNGEPYNQVSRVFNPRKGAYVWVHTISNPYTDASGQVTHYDGMVIDLTDQVSIQESERRRRAAEGLRDILRMINSNQPLAQILDAIARQSKTLLEADSTMIRQVSPDENRVRTVASCDLPPDFSAIAEQPFYRAPADQQLLLGETVTLEDVPGDYLPRLADPQFRDPLRRAGLEVTVRHYRSLLKTPLIVKGQIFGAITFHYIQPRSFGEEDLRLAAVLADQAALAIENARLIEKVKETAVHEERSRLARELHDAVTQTLFSTTLTAEVLPKIWEKNPQEGRRKLDELRELTRGALAEMRTLLIELRPSALEDADLKDLLKHLTNAFIARARIPAGLIIDGPAAEIPLEVKIAFYRIAQEALQNIARHAEAGQVTVELSQAEGAVRLAVEDDGQGFDPTVAHPAHFGLSIMQERAAQVGAAITITSQPGRGTRVLAEWRTPQEAL